MNGTNSDYDSTMAAALKFYAILTTVQSSNLNFHVEISPFSAKIHLKKSLIVNKFRIPQIPPPPKSLLLEQQKSYGLVLTQRIVFLENSVNKIKGDYESVLLDTEEAHKTIAKLTKALEIVHAKEEKDEAASEIKIRAMEKDLIGKSELIETLEKENSDHMVKIKTTKKSVKIERDEKNEFEARIQNLEAIVKNLNFALSKTTLKMNAENSSLEKNHKIVIKHWRKELGQERKLRKKVEKRLEKLSEKDTPAVSLDASSPSFE